MLLKIIVIEWYKVIKERKNFDIEKTWRIFWTRARNQWESTAKDKEYELRNIAQRGSNTKTTWIGINRQLKPLGTIDRATFEITCLVDWKKYS